MIQNALECGQVFCPKVLRTVHESYLVGGMRSACPHDGSRIAQPLKHVSAAAGIERCPLRETCYITQLSNYEHCNPSQEEELPMPVVRRGLPRLGPALAALALMVCAMFTPVSAHASGTGLDSVAEALKKSPVYVDPRARDQLSEADAADLAKKIEDAGKPVFVAVLPESAEFPPKTLMRDLRTQVGITGVYAVHLGDGFNANADSSVMSRNAVGNLTGAVKRSHPGDPEGLLTAFVDQATEQAKGQAPATWSGSEDDEGSGGAAVLLTVGAVAAVGGGGYALYRRSKKKRERAELDALRVVVDEDITAFGEELDRLDFHPSEPGADDVMRQDYTHALDTYDKAKELMVTAARPQDVQPVTAALEEGRFALATLAARRAGSPVPERRAPASSTLATVRRSSMRCGPRPTACRATCRPVRLMPTSWRPGRSRWPVRCRPPMVPSPTGMPDPHTHLGRAATSAARAACSAACSWARCWVRFSVHPPRSPTPRPSTALPTAVSSPVPTSTLATSEVVSKVAASRAEATSAVETGDPGDRP